MRPRASAAVLAVVTAAACGGGPPPASPNAALAPSSPPADAAAPTSDAGAAPDAGPLPSLDALASRGSALAPGLHEVARVELSGGAAAATSQVLFRAEVADACLRVALAADPAVHARIVDARGDVLAEIATASDAALAPRGPVCVRRGDSFAIVIDASTSWVAHVVAWASAPP